MSYARFGSDGSDVYVFPAGDAQNGYLVCSGCGIRGDSVWTSSTAEMVDHLRNHITNGHHVPDSVIPDLQADDVKNFPPREYP